jgi:AcrR family transcriptional regulator
MDGRTQRRIAGMRRVQAAALDLFEERGFRQVSVEEIAARAEVGPASVYRYFTTKERIVLWDEYDPMLLEAIARELAEHPPIEAVVRAIESTLDDVYEKDRKRILRRSRLTLSEPTIYAASEQDRAALREALSELLGGELAGDVTAAAVVATLETTVRHWVDGRARTPFRTVLRAAFRALRRALSLEHEREKTRRRRVCKVSLSARTDPV